MKIPKFSGKTLSLVHWILQKHIKLEIFNLLNFFVMEENLEYKCDMLRLNIGIQMLY